MQPNFITSHQLAKILLQYGDFPVVIPSLNDESKGELLEDINLFQNDLSPFEYVMVLTNRNISNIIEIQEI